LLPAWLQHRLNQSHPTTLLLLSFLAVILTGTLVLLVLTLPGKLMIIALMIIGRVGVPVITYIIVGGPPKKGLQFAEENLMIG
jgi:trk system potassium uptake protein